MSFYVINGEAAKSWPEDSIAQQSSYRVEHCGDRLGPSDFLGSGEVDYDMFVDLSPIVRVCEQ